MPVLPVKVKMAFEKWFQATLFEFQKAESLRGAILEVKAFKALVLNKERADLFKQI